MTRDPSTSTRTSRPIRLLLVGPLAIAGAIAATACGPGPTAQPAKDTAPVADQAPAAVDESDVSTIVENPSGPRSALLDGAEFARAVEAAIAALPADVGATG